MDIFFSSPALFDDLHTVTLNCRGIVRPNRKGILKNIGHKMKLKGNLTAIVWKDKQNVNIQMDIHSPPLEVNFCDKHRKAVKPAIIQDYLDTWDMWKILTTLRNLTLSAHRLGNGHRSYSSIFWILPFSTALSFLPPVVQNYHTIETDNDEGPNIRGGKGALTSDRKTEKTSLIHKSTKKT
jgi:hypothetical protein